jgi:hypothetical protein
VEQKTISCRRLASVVGKLVFATRALPAGRPFYYRANRCWRDRPVGSTIRLTKEMKADFSWWIDWLPKWEGIALIPSGTWVNSATIQLWTDACEVGYGVVYGKDWICEKWSSSQLALASRATRLSMPFLEMYALVSAAMTFGAQWRGQRIVFHCDCAPVVNAVTHGRARDPHLAALIRVLANEAVCGGWEWRCVWLAGKTNVLSDHLSRQEVGAFLALYPMAHSTCTRPRGVPHLAPHF